MKCEFFTVFPWKMIGNLHVLVGTSNGLVSRRERDVTLAWRRQSGYRKSGSDYFARSRVLNWRSRRVAKSLYCLIPSASPRPLSSGENPLTAGLDYMRQKRERTGTSFYVDWIKNLNISTDTQFNLAYGGFARNTNGGQNVPVLLNQEHWLFTDWTQ